MIQAAEGREFWITGAAMRVGDFRADMVSQWVGKCFDGELHAKRIASLSDGVLGVLHSTSLAVSAIGLALAQAHGLKAKHATKQVDRLLRRHGLLPSYPPRNYVGGRIIFINNSKNGNLSA